MCSSSSTGVLLCAFLLFLVGRQVVSASESPLRQVNFRLSIYSPGMCLYDCFAIFVLFQSPLSNCSHSLLDFAAPLPAFVPLLKVSFLLKSYTYFRLLPECPLVLLGTDWICLEGLLFSSEGSEACRDYDYIRRKPLQNSSLLDNKVVYMLYALQCTFACLIVKRSPLHMSTNEVLQWDCNVGCPTQLVTNRKRQRVFLSGVWKGTTLLLLMVICRLLCSTTLVSFPIITNDYIFYYH